MGMFDYIRCQYPLPVDGANALTYQTKDTDAQFCDNYEIRADGSLWHEEYDVEDRSDPNAEGLMRIVGAMTRVNKRWVRDAMTGEIRFYTFWDDAKNEGWVEFSAYLVDGVVNQLHVITNRKGES